jgi:hypothetical protein
VLKEIAFSTASAFLLLLSGCSGGQDIASVEGLVTMDGKPLPRATVVFIPEVGGRPAGSQTDKDGKYVLNFSGGRKGAIPGKNKVQISTRADPFLDAEGNNLGSPETVPAEYNVHTTLAFEVVQGQRNIANFELKSDGKVIRDRGGY